MLTLAGGGLLFSFKCSFSDVGGDDDTNVSLDDLEDNVSMLLMVDDRRVLGMGNPLKWVKSQDRDFLGVGRVDPASEATGVVVEAEVDEGAVEGASLLVTLPRLLMLAVSLSLSESSLLPLPGIHQIPEGFDRTLISSVFCTSISPINETQRGKASA